MSPKEVRCFLFVDPLLGSRFDRSARGGGWQHAGEAPLQRGERGICARRVAGGNAVAQMVAAAVDYAKHRLLAAGSEAMKLANVDVHPHIVPSRVETQVEFDAVRDAVHAMLAQLVVPER